MPEGASHSREAQQCDEIRKEERHSHQSSVKEHLELPIRDELCHVVATVSGCGNGAKVILATATVQSVEIQNRIEF